MANNAFLRPRINIHTKFVQSPQNSQGLSKHIYTSSILSLHKDTKPGRVKRHAQAVNQKVDFGSWIFNVIACIFRLP